MSFAVAAFRGAWDLAVLHDRSVAALFVDIQAAYYETSRMLLFQGDPGLEQHADRRLRHLACLSEQLAHQGALAALGTPAEEVDLLLDCVACSHWQLVGSGNIFIATRGSRPGDGLADILFGALFSIALRHIRAVCAAEGILHVSATSYIGSTPGVLPIGWADDLAVLADFETPSELQVTLPRLADVVISTLEHIRFRVNLGVGKTEAIVELRGPKAKQVRGEMLGGDSTLALPDGRRIRLAPKYRYLGVIQQPRDTGRRDQELSAQRAHSAWAQARTLLASSSMPWPLKHAWLAGRVLPAAYATIATAVAVSQRATAPLEGFFERAVRTLLASWRYGHRLTKPCLYTLAGLPSPYDATVVARVRLVALLCRQAPRPVWDIFEAGWNRDTRWGALLTDACREVLPAVSLTPAPTYITLQLLLQQWPHFVRACKHLSRYGSTYRSFWALWRDVTVPRSKQVIGTAGHFTCPLCGSHQPSQQALAAHIHRKHTIVNVLTSLTAGTTCLWCHQEHYSTDRLKYHLRRSASCVHGLRVVVGSAYSYGSGSKRTGPRGHRGLPALRLPGPVNATPVQRQAALEGRAPTDAELQDELYRATGATGDYQWPSDRTPGVLRASTVHETSCSPGPPPDLSSARPLLLPDSGSDGPTWRNFVDAADPLAVDIPSPWWPGLQREGTYWGLPSAWHRYWKLWLAAESTPDSWSSQVRCAQAPLRRAGPATASGPSTVMSAIVANTVSFRLICWSVNASGLLWVRGVPSAAGISLLRLLLPQARFHVTGSIYGRVFVALHPSLPFQVWGPRVVDVADSVFVGRHTPGCLLQPSLVYHPRSLG